MVFLVGDCLVAAAFLSYMGPFLSEYRDHLVKEVWLKDVSLRNLRRNINLCYNGFMLDQSRTGYNNFKSIWKVLGVEA